jgi:tetratricopeptide (TPR) repeat protein
MRPRTLALLGCLLIAAAACQSPAPPQPPARVEEDPASRARAALEAGRYAEAAGLFRQALEHAPDSVPARFGLAVALSYTDRGAATPEFQWVLANAQPGSQEAAESRAWLARAGALPRTAAQRATAAEHEMQTGNSALVGRALFAEKGEKPQPMPRMQLFLVGQPDSPTKEERYNLRTDQEGNFKFPNVVPGPYMLTNRVAGQPIWRLRVELKPSEEKQLSLDPANSVTVRDDFPQPR